MLEPGRKLDPVKGYIRIGKVAVSKEFHWIYDALRGGRFTVFEHRLVMSISLNRPIKNTELVDHIDGNKTNNSPGNLRIYLRGTNMPGNTSGYGLFYHEWQSALSEIESLRTEIVELKKPAVHS